MSYLDQAGYWRRSRGKQRGGHALPPRLYQRELKHERFQGARKEARKAVQAQRAHLLSKVLHPAVLHRAQEDVRAIHEQLYLLHQTWQSQRVVLTAPGLSTSLLPRERESPPGANLVLPLYAYDLLISVAFSLLVIQVDCII